VQFTDSEDDSSLKQVSRLPKKRQITMPLDTSSEMLFMTNEEYSSYDGTSSDEEKVLIPSEAKSLIKDY
jgi:hypothetical protein